MLNPDQIEKVREALAEYNMTPLEELFVRLPPPDDEIGGEFSD